MRPSRSFAVAALATTLAVAVAPAALGQSGDTLAVDVSVDDAEAALSNAQATLDELRTQLAVLRFERSEFERRLSQRHEREDKAARDLREARVTAEGLAVEAYMGAGVDLTPDLLAFGDDDPLEYLFRSTLVADSTNARYRAAEYYRDLQDQASDAVTSTVTHLDDLDAAIVATEEALADAEDAERTAAIVLEEAEAAEEAAEAEATLASTSSGSTPPGDGWVPIGEWPGGPSAEEWAALRQCESSGNYHAVSASGLYRGAYQFDLGTWESVGGSGDPAMAPAEEQDHRAQLLYSQRGASPWPVCGSYLS